MDRGGGVERGIAGLSYASWRRFFRAHVLRGAGYASRLLRFVEVLRDRSGTPSAVKIVMGVIGRDTVGPSRGIQACFSDLLGVECVGCREAVERISLGIPPPQVLGSVSLRFRGSELLDRLRVLEGLLRESLRVSIGLDIDEGYLASLVERDYAALAGNPLRVFSMVRGLLMALRKLLPLHNPHTFFLQALRWVPRFALERLLDGGSLGPAERFGVRIVELLPSVRDEYSLLTHKPGSTGDLITSAADLVYGVYEVVLPHTSRYLRVRDARGSYIVSVIPTLGSVAEALGVRRELSLVESALLGATSGTGGGAYRLVRLTLRFENPARSVSLGGRRLPIEVFMRGISPYLVLGLARFERVSVGEGTAVADLSVHLRAG